MGLLIAILSFFVVFAIGCGKPYHAFDPRRAPADLTSSGGMLSIKQPAANAIVGPEVSLTGECVSGTAVEISGTGAESRLSTPCDNGGFSVNVTLTTGDGIKNIIVTQNDAGGNRVTSRSFVKDGVAPALQISAPADNSASRGTVDITGLCETGLPVQVYGPGLSAPLNGDCVDGLFSLNITLAGTDGAKMVYLAQTDAAGNQTRLARALTRDTLAPSLTITAPAANTSAASSLTVTGTCESGLAVQIAGTGAASSVSQTCVAGAFSIPFVMSAGDGTKPVTVSSKDVAGNETTLNRSFARLNTGPAIAINAPAANSVARSGVTVQGTCVSGLPVVISGQGISASVNAACTAGAFSAAINFSNADGTKNIVVTQTNAAGLSGMDSRNFVRDTTAPSLTISAPVANASVKTSVTVRGTCETGLTVTIGGAVTAANTTCTAAMFSANVNLSAGDGAKTITVTQTDAVGNSASRSVTITRDTVAPALTITGPAAGTVAATGLSVQGTCEFGLNVDLAGAGLAAPVSAPCAGGAYDTEVMFSTGDGDKTVEVSQTDLAGNRTAVTRNFIRGAPVVPADGPALYATNCQNCHGVLSQSSKRGRTAAQISGAIGTQPSMAGLISLTSAQVNAIAAALSNSVPNPVACAPETVAKPAVRRLNAREFSNSVRDLLGETIDPSTLPKDDLNAMGFDNDGGILRLSDLDAQKYLDSLQSAVDSLFAKGTNPFACSNAAGTSEATKRACTSTKLTPLITKAFKKSATTAEVTKFVDFARTETDVNEGLKKSIMAVLMHPSFIYFRADTSAAPAGSVTYRLSGIELAHKLSLMIWSSVPDDALLTAAQAGQLANSANLRTQVARMVADPKFNQGMGKGFVDDWLELPRLNGLAKSNTGISDFSDAYLGDMAEESRQFVQYVVRNDRPVSELFSAQYSFVNQRMANVYGLGGTFTNAQFKMTTLPGTERRGLLTHPSIMTLTGKSESTSPVKRGHWVTKRVLCSEPPPPPPDVPAFPENPSGNLSVKQRLAAHRTSASCAGCHTQMDPVGIGLENFSQIGKWRTSYGTMPVDATEVFDAKPFNGPIELAGILAPREDVKICFTKHVAAYSLGRTVQNAESCYIDQAIRRADTSTKGILTLIQELVDSELFTQQKIGE